MSHKNSCRNLVADDESESRFLYKCSHEASLGLKTYRPPLSRKTVGLPISTPRGDQISQSHMRKRCRCRYKGRTSS
nr:MAG TPA: hypothetical protein [Caudoviricetes sp.]